MVRPIGHGVSWLINYLIDMLDLCILLLKYVEVAKTYLHKVMATKKKDSKLQSRIL